jgi:hypothetical protein
MMVKDWSRGCNLYIWVQKKGVVFKGQICFSYDAKRTRQHTTASTRKIWLQRVNQYFTRDNVSMKVVGYDDGTFVQFAHTSDLSLVKLIDLDIFLSLLPPRRVTN